MGIRRICHKNRRVTSSSVLPDNLVVKEIRIRNDDEKDDKDLIEIPHRFPKHDNQKLYPKGLYDDRTR